MYYKSLVLSLVLSITSILSMLLYFCPVKADSFQDLMETKQTLLKAGNDGPLYFEGDDYANRGTEVDSWPLMDSNDSSFSNFVTPIDTSIPLDDPKAMVIPAGFNTLSLNTPANYYNYEPDPTKPGYKDNIYTNLHNFVFANRGASWTARPSDRSFYIQNNHEKASLIVRKVAFTNHNWIDMVYSIKLAGDNYAHNWTKDETRDPSRAYGPHDQDSGLVSLNLGTASDSGSWFNLDTNSASPRNFDAVRGSKTSEASRWTVKIKFVKNRQTATDNQPDETDDPAIDAPGLYQFFNVNTQKIFALPYDKLGSQQENKDEIFVLTGKRKTRIRGHKDTNGYFDIRAGSSDSGYDGVSQERAFVYAYKHGQFEFTNVRSANTTWPHAMFITTSDNPLVRAELPDTELGVTMNNLGKITDTTGDEVHPTVKNKIIYDPATVQFQLFQKFPKQPQGGAPTNYHVNFTVPDYVHIDSPQSIDIKSLTDNPLSNSVVQLQNLSGGTPSNGSRKYVYVIDANTLLGQNGFDGFDNFPIEADLNFTIDWDKQDSSGEYPWKKYLYTKYGTKYVRVAAKLDSEAYRSNIQGTESKFKKSSSDQTHYDSTGKDEFETLVKVPEQTYEFDHLDANNKPININSSTKPSITSVKADVGTKKDETDQVTKIIQDTSGYYHKFDHATITDDKGNIQTLSWAALQKYLTNLEFKYNNNQSQAIKLYYGTAQTRVKFHYWQLNTTNSVNPINYYKTNPPTQLPADLYNLQADSTNDNFTIGDYLNPIPIQEELPTNKQDIVAPSANPSDDYNSTGDLYQGAPAPKIAGQKYIGYYQYSEKNNKATFYKYDPTKNNSQNNAWVQGNYDSKNQVVAFVYLPENEASNRHLAVTSNLDFGSGYSFQPQFNNQDSFQLAIGDKFSYVDQDIQWPQRNWQVLVKGKNFHRVSDTLIPPTGATITFTPLTTPTYTHSGVADNTNSINKSLSDSFGKKGLEIALDNNEETVLNAQGLKDAANVSTTGPYLKTEDLKLNWDPNKIKLKVPDGFKAGKYKTSLDWTFKDSLE